MVDKNKVGSPAHTLMRGAKGHAEGGHAPAHTLMRGGKCYAQGGHASGGSERAERAMGGAMFEGGRRLYRPEFKPWRNMPEQNIMGRSGAGLSPENARKRQASIDMSRSEGFATGGAPTANTTLKRGGRRSRHASGDTVNAHTGHPGYGLLDSVMKGLKAGAGNMIRAHYGMDPGFAEGGHAARGGRLFQREFADGGKTLRKGGRRYADGGTTQPLQGMANQVAPVVAPNDRMANLAYGTTPPTGRDTSNSDSNQTPTMKRGGRRSRHAAGEAVRDQATHSMHRAMGGAGKTRKHYPYT